MRHTTGKVRSILLNNMHRLGMLMLLAMKHQRMGITCKREKNQSLIAPLVYEARNLDQSEYKNRRKIQDRARLRTKVLIV